MVEFSRRCRWVREGRFESGGNRRYDMWNDVPTSSLGLMSSREAPVCHVGFVEEAGKRRCARDGAAKNGVN